MATQPYYELLLQLKTHRERQSAWRWKVTQALEELRTTLASFLGVSFLHLNNGQYRYVELFTPEFKPFHLSADGVIDIVNHVTIANAYIAVALEGEMDIIPYASHIQVRCRRGVVEFRIKKENGRWTPSASIMAEWVYHQLRQALSQPFLTHDVRKLPFKPSGSSLC